MTSTDHHFIWASEGVSCRFTVNPQGIAKLKPRTRGKTLRSFWAAMDTFHERVPDEHKPKFMEWKYSVYDYAVSAIGQEK